MRHRVALMWMALGIMAAGTASAGDATQVVYDLSTLRTPQVASPATHTSRDIALPADPAPMSMPSLKRNADSDLLVEDGNLEVRNRNHAPHQGAGAGSPRDGQGTQPGNPSPTPEPGTLMLLGGALASGARFLRRR